jgi:hypothetical protein
MADPITFGALLHFGTAALSAGNTVFKYSRQRSVKKEDSLRVRKLVIDTSFEAIDVLMDIGRLMGRLGVINVKGAEAMWDTVYRVLTENMDELAAQLIQELKKAGELGLGRSFLRSSSESRARTHCWTGVLCCLFPHAHLLGLRIWSTK